MGAGGTTIARRFAAVGVAMLLVGSAWSGVAMAQPGTGGGGGGIGDNGSPLPRDPDATFPNIPGPDPTTTPPAEDPTTTPPADDPDPDPDPTTTEAPTSPPIVPTTGTSPTGPSGTPSVSDRTTVRFAPIYIDSGKYGHRHYGRYWDDKFDCYRYVVPANYVAPVVFATQVARVPKGGVDTGDGSFR